ncbi:hypothetical protein JYU34_003321 [Plutella xylostella]|uniref:Uncharacterized protein n=1 Tax=Plutella xylostella TaxID=51655 RepID=A0ABQ7QZS0_PLUXY|nr:hypothetical protein JYU34_003321 [Plutella xylostella]
MKLPYVVSSNTREAYATSSLMKESLGEASRRVRAEDFEWEEAVTPPPLSYLAVVALSQMFERLNPLDSILQKDRDLLMDLYPDSIPLKFSVPLIEDEHYWKRCLNSKFPTQKELGITFYKGRYLSMCLQEHLENANPDVFVEDDALELITLVSPHIYELKLRQLRMVRQPRPPPLTDEVVDRCPWSVPPVHHHIPLELVLNKLHNLKELTLVFGVNNLEENYEPRLFELSIADCESLCIGLENLQHFRALRINRSNLDCSKVKVILQRLVKKESIEELDFNHCKIGDHGMKALGGFISLHNNIKVVRIANNRFGAVGARGLAYALQMKPAAPIELIDLSLNQLCLESACAMAAALVRCREKPQALLLNACGLEGASADKIVGLLGLNRGLTRLDLAANDLSGAEETLLDALDQNRRLLKMDLRSTGVSEETEQKVSELLDRNRRLIGQETEPSEEIPPLYLNQPEYLVWEYHPDNPDHIPGRYPPRVPEV